VRRVAENVRYRKVKSGFVVLRLWFLGCGAAQIGRYPSVGLHNITSPKDCNHNLSSYF
jgi:hypothetical protein